MVRSLISNRKLALPQDEQQKGDNDSKGSVIRQNHDLHGLVFTGRIWGHGEEASATREAFKILQAQGVWKGASYGGQPP